MPKCITTAKITNANQSLIIVQLLNLCCLQFYCTRKAWVCQPKKSPPKWAWLFLLRGISYPRRRLGGQCEQFVVCVYGFCFYGQETPTLTVFTLPGRSYPYLLLNRSPCHPHLNIQHTLRWRCRLRSRVLNTFLSKH